MEIPYFAAPCGLLFASCRSRPWEMRRAIPNPPLLASTWANCWAETSHMVSPVESPLAPKPPSEPDSWAVRNIWPMRRASNWRAAPAASRGLGYSLEAGSAGMVANGDVNNDAAAPAGLDTNGFATVK